MTSCTALEVLHWHQELLDFLRELNEQKMAASETGQLDAWQYQHDRLTAELAQLENLYPHLAT